MALSLAGKTLFITGASRGIGLAIALRAARDGANIAIAAKTEKPHPKLAGTIYTAAEEIERAGGKALPLVSTCVTKRWSRTHCHRPRRGSAASISSSIMPAQLVTPVVDTEMKRFDPMNQINARGTFVVSKWAIGHLEKATNPHTHDLAAARHERKVVRAAPAYSMAKFGMSLVVLGLAGELRPKELP